ncbi:hypothetical protein [Altibacter sp.]|uniref:hypothetical protein n=1 Tax=Altibacter sp. TaxID=2024823 RepID=UPI0025B83070|nr:hypothetical protein [Altibacter sp.]|tara:strand:+ start:1504 stop:1671 length:168 start_codon:yes stop_codon:yes gene_type:complete
MNLEKIYDEFIRLTEEAKKFNKTFSFELEKACFTLAGYIMAMDDLNGDCGCDDED